MEVLLKGQLHALLAHGGVHGVVGVQGILQVLLVQGAHRAQDMGGIGGLVLADKGTGDLGAGVAAVVDEGDELRGDILRQHVCVVGAQLADGQLILNTQHQPGLVPGIAGGDVEIRLHPFNEPGHGDACLHQQMAGEVLTLQSLQQRGGIRGGDGLSLLRHRLRVGGQVGDQGFPGGLQVFQIGKETVLLGGGDVINRKGERRLPGYGQIIHPVHALLPAQLQQPQDGVVLVLTVLQQGGVEGQGIGGAVGYQGPAAAVGDNAPGGLHLLLLGDGVDGSGQIIVVVVDLDIIQDAQIDQDGQGKQACQHIQTAIVGFFVVHGSLLFNRRTGSGGKQRKTAASREGSTPL